ncbi:MAG: hypothetical protein A07HB70_00638 [uncultured archaeon A07HB70]|nr:MAG: hypothetical protein A07HB70_00638 [uncultured archaeon A07HB70]
MDRVTPEWVDSRLDGLSYPVTRADAAAALADTDVVVDGDEQNLGRLVSRTDADAFRGPEAVVDAVERALDGSVSDGHPD